MKLTQIALIFLSLALVLSVGAVTADSNIYPPRITSFKANPTLGTGDTIVKFYGTAIDEDGTQLTYTLDFDTNNIKAPNRRSGVITGTEKLLAENNYLAPASGITEYTARLTISDGEATSAREIKIKIFAPEVPDTPPTETPPSVQQPVAPIVPTIPLTGATGSAQETTISALSSNPSAYSGATVIVIGKVTEKKQAPKIFGISIGGGFNLVDDSGNKVSVGYLGEQKVSNGDKVKVKGTYANFAGAGIITASKIEKVGGLPMLWIIIVVVAVVAVLVILLLYFFVMRKPSSGPVMSAPAAPAKMPPKAPPSAPPAKGAPPAAPKK